jgi:1-deoxy-D-xylulose-5-phosphate synthase
MGGFGSAVLEFANLHGYKNSIEILGLPDEFIEQGVIEELETIGHIDGLTLKKSLTKLLYEVS